MTKVKSRPKILEHVKGNAGEAAIVRSLAGSDLKLSAIHHMVGPMCISGDEILKILLLIKHWSQKRLANNKNHEVLVKKKAMQEKTKAVNAAGEILKNNLQLLLCWKLAENEY